MKNFKASCEIYKFYCVVCKQTISRKNSMNRKMFGITKVEDTINK